ncbi:MAG: response regulator [Burkholderiales bacterium]|nr:response regulator [Burkholderiales bacterium]
MQVAIIDDTQMNVTFMQHLVKKLPGCTPVTFTDPLVALDWCLDKDPDLLIVDQQMPGLSGIELVKRFRVRHPDTPTLMVTANCDKELRYEALGIGVTDFLTKPVDNVEFLARARNMLALRESHKKVADHAAFLADRNAWLDDEVRKKTQAIVAQAQETVICLAKAAEHRDPETGAHILRMSHYSRLIARRLGLSTEQQDLLLAAAPMHDIGKVAIPDMILLKAGKLDDEEMAIMRRHAFIGYQVLSVGTSPLLQTAAQIAHSHHEKFDGSGYPQGLKGEAIPLFGRIVAVADVFDALTSARPYKTAWTVERARQLLIDGKGSHFDPACVDALLGEWDEALEIKQRFKDDEIKECNSWLE